MANLCCQHKIKLGIATLDSHYETLYEMLQKFDEAISRRDTTKLELFSRQIKKLCMTIYNYERPLFITANHSTATEEIRKYRSFLDKIERLNIELDRGDELTAARKLLFEVKSWLNEHLDQLHECLSKNKKQKESSNNSIKLISRLFKRLHQKS